MNKYDMEVGVTKNKCISLLEDIWDLLDFCSKAQEGSSESHYYLTQAYRKIGTATGILNRSLRRFGRIKNIIKKQAYNEIFDYLDEDRTYVLREMNSWCEIGSLYRRRNHAIKEEAYEEAGRLQRIINHTLIKDAITRARQSERDTVFK